MFESEAGLHALQVRARMAICIPVCASHWAYACISECGIVRLQYEAMESEARPRVLARWGIVAAIAALMGVLGSGVYIVSSVGVDARVAWINSVTIAERDGLVRACVHAWVKV